MKKRMSVTALLAIAAMLIGGSAEAEFTLYKFNDIPTSFLDPGSGFRYGSVPPAGQSDYMGFIFTGWEAADNGSYKAVFGNSTNFGSPPVALFNATFGTAAIAAGPTFPTFDYNGSWFATFALGDAFSAGSATSLTITGYLGGKPVPGDTKTIDLTTGGQFWWNQITFYGIDKLVFTPTDFAGNSGSGYFIMDCAQLGSPSTVPVPPSLYLLAAGLIGPVLWRRRLTVRNERGKACQC